MHRLKHSSNQRYIPAYAEHPFRLGWKLLVHPRPAARSALLMAAAGLLLAPLDKLLESRERKLCITATPPTKPVILVCGPPRSGTSLVAQYLINSLDTAYINNLTSLFPRSPLYANRLLAGWVRWRAGDYDAFYGKSCGLAGNNDGLQVWDRWLGSERDLVPAELLPGAEENISQFFGALQEQSGLSIVNKLNRLVGSAHLVAPVLPLARFVFVWRDPVMLAQSLLLARKQLTGSLGKPYGLNADVPSTGDPIEDVCQQVEFFHSLIKQQVRLIGEDRCIVVVYSKFCVSPANILDRIRTEWKLDLPPRDATECTEVFSESASVRIPAPDFGRLQERLIGLKDAGVMNEAWETDGRHDH